MAWPGGRGGGGGGGGGKGGPCPQPKRTLINWKIYQKLGGGGGGEGGVGHGGHAPPQTFGKFSN